jgi:hypothetical protein
MVYRRERPKIRKCLETAMAWYGWSIKELREFTSYDPECIDWKPIFCLWPTWKVQLRKMLEEEKQQGVF